MTTNIDDQLGRKAEDGPVPVDPSSEGAQRSVISPVITALQAALTDVLNVAPGSPPIVLSDPNRRDEILQSIREDRYEIDPRQGITEYEHEALPAVFYD